MKSGSGRDPVRDIHCDLSVLQPACGWGYWLWAGTERKASETLMDMEHDWRGLGEGPKMILKVETGWSRPQRTGHQKHCTGEEIMALWFITTRGTRLCHWPFGCH